MDFTFDRHAPDRRGQGAGTRFPRSQALISRSDGLDFRNAVNFQNLAIRSRETLFMLRELSFR
jgi:hypothetical protein